MLDCVGDKHQCDNVDDYSLIHSLADNIFDVGLEQGSWKDKPERQEEYRIDYRHGDQNILPLKAPVLYPDHMGGIENRRDKEQEYPRGVAGGKSIPTCHDKVG